MPGCKQPGILFFVSIRNCEKLAFKKLSIIIHCFLEIPGFCEGAEAAVESFFDVIGEAAAGKLPRRQMIAQALTAHPLFVTAGVRTVAIF